jgi:UDP-glucose 4-epimerase
MRVAVTGGAGFIGRATCKQLRELGHEPIVLDRSTRFDVRDRSKRSLIRNCDACIHLAGVLGTSELFSMPSEAVDVNVQGTLNVLEACRAGDVAYVGITMPDSQWPSIYQATKLAATRLASAYHHTYGFPVTHIRAFNAYGVGQAHGPGHPRKIIPSFATRSWNRQAIEIWGDGTQTVDLVHVDHVAHCLAHAATHGDISPTRGLASTPMAPTPTTYGVGRDQVWDAGTGQPMTVLEVAHMIGDITGHTQIRHMPMRDGETHQSHICAKDPGPFGYDTMTMDRMSETVLSYRTSKTQAA